MVDHTWAVPHSFAARSVRLFDDVAHWEAQILNAWNDLRDPNSPYELHIVLPKPPTPDVSVVAHIVFIQRPSEDWVTSVITCFERISNTTQVRQAALTTHEHFFLGNLLRVLGRFEQCHGPYPAFSCQAWYGVVPLQLGAPIPGRSGYGITIQIRPSYRSHPSHSNRGLAHAPVLLQLSSLLETTPRSAGKERLTTATMAHEQWPLIPHDYVLKMRGGSQYIMAL